MSTLTAANIKIKFPEFAGTDDAQIEFAIEEAARNVDDTWLEKDKMLGWMYMTAHYLMVSISRAASGTGQQIQSERIGEISVTYATSQQPTIASPSDLTTTPYGTRFLELANLNFPPVLVI
jgi:Protein of unknown function (DUF4054)